MKVIKTHFLCPNCAKLSNLYFRWKDTTWEVWLKYCPHCGRGVYNVDITDYERLFN